MTVYINGVASIDYPEKLKSYTAADRWVIPGWFAYSTMNTVMGQGVLYYIPIFVPETTTYIGIGIFVGVSAAGKLARLGIYEWDNGSPGALILDAGTVSVGTALGKAIIIAQTLPRGYYFLAIVSDGTPQLRAQDLGDGCVTPVDGFQEGNNLIYDVTLLTV
ncbi:unnamed protein product, partial [marine sediment metagenome]